MVKYAYTEILDLLKSKPRLKLKPQNDSSIVIVGVIEDKVKYNKFNTIEFAYNVKIVIPEKYPNELPEIFMDDESIKPDIDLHIESNGKICLGVPLRLMKEFRKVGNLKDYIDSVLIPFLYGLTYKIKYGKFPFNEVYHGYTGLFNEYKKLLHLSNAKSIKKALELLGMESGNALFERCPCGCGRLYASCSFKEILEPFRNLSAKEWYYAEAEKIGN